MTSSTTTGASASVCSPATVVFSTIVPRGRTSPSAVVSPDGEPVRADIARITSIWRDCRNLAAAAEGDDGFLFGRYSIADMMYAPVVWRFHSYGVDMPESCAAYAELMRGLPAMKEWATAARDEPWVMEKEER